MCLIVKDKLTVKILKEKRTVYKVLRRKGEIYYSPYFQENGVY